VNVKKALTAARFPITKPTWPNNVPRPNPKRNVGLDYDTAWARRYPARLARAIFTDFISAPLVDLVAPTTIVGADALSRQQGPVIFAANHNSHADTAVLLKAIPQHLRHKVVVAAASDFFFDSTTKATVMSLVLGAIPIERSKVNRRSAETALELLEEGWSVIIYPEGGRSPDGWMHDFKGGAAYLSVRAGAPVVPVFIDGTDKVLPKSRVEPGVAPGGSGTEDRLGSKLRRHPVSVTFGRPLRPDEDTDARRFGGVIEEAVAQLGREVASDYYQARRHVESSLTYGPPAAPWRRAWARPPAIKVSARVPSDAWPTTRF
jgi:1-acyl-sn-glycerol-3-phosphate acyltransferase